MSVLYIIATPIGNLGDFSLRGLEILRQIDLILCEDTRITKKLLNHYKISKPTISYHQHSKLSKVEYILEQLKKGKNLALVSDAGTPCISDPGAKLISYLSKKLPDLKIVPIPGPSALITALSISGLPADKFVFLGFPPIKKKRKQFFKEIADSKYTVVFYESCHRIIKTLKELNPQLEIVVCRELTKKFETIYRGRAEDVIEQIKTPKGEFVVVVGKKEHV
jgi:16S rRNA (cytidine1402-2'-O)-methyltransferase